MKTLMILICLPLLLGSACDEVALYNYHQNGFDQGDAGASRRCVADCQQGAEAELHKCQPFFEEVQASGEQVQGKEHHRSLRAEFCMEQYKDRMRECQSRCDGR